MSENISSENDDEKEYIRDFLESHNIDKIIIDRVIDSIEFGEINTETGKPILKIYWAWD